MDRKLFSIVIPVYKNEMNLSTTFAYMMEHLGLFLEYEIEIIMVCDGSPDRSWEVMQEIKKRYPNLLHIIKLDKNYGQRMAVIAGVSAAQGEAIGVISADLQDPFELFADMLEKWEQGYQLVAGCRKKRNDGFGKDLFARAYHRFVHKYVDNRYPDGGFDFFVVDKSMKYPMINHVLKYGGMQFLLLELTNRICFIPYERKKRKVGKSGYTVKQLIQVVVTMTVIHTDILFYWLILFGVFICAGSFIGTVILALTLKRLAVAFAGIVIFLLGICISAVGFLGVSLFRWAQNFRNLPKYRIEKEERRL